MKYFATIGIIVGTILFLGGTSANALCNYKVGGACIDADRSKGWNKNCTDRCEKSAGGKVKIGKPIVKAPKVN